MDWQKFMIIMGFSWGLGWDYRVRWGECGRRLYLISHIDTTADRLMTGSNSTS